MTWSTIYFITMFFKKLRHSSVFQAVSMAAEAMEGVGNVSCALRVSNKISSATHSCVLVGLVEDTQAMLRFAVKQAEFDEAQIGMLVTVLCDYVTDDGIVVCCGARKRNTEDTAY